MQFHPNELFLLYDPDTGKGKQTKAYALSISNHVNEVNPMKTKLTTTLWKEIVGMLKLDPKEILDKSHADYQAKVSGNTFTMEGWLEVLNNNPQLIKAPIAIYNKIAILCNTPQDVLKLEYSSPATGKALPHLRNPH
jgi:arsenate reductase (glutaredoxin)